MQICPLDLLKPIAKLKCNTVRCTILSRSTNKLIRCHLKAMTETESHDPVHKTLASILTQICKQTSHVLIFSSHNVCFVTRTT